MGTDSAPASPPRRRFAGYEILAELGLDPKQIGALRASGVIAGAPVPQPVA